MRAMPIAIAEKEDIFLVTLDNHPFNILTVDIIDALYDFFSQKKTKPIILTGAGRNFSAGADIKHLFHMNEEAAAQFSEKGQLLCAAIAAQSMVVAALHGYCLGGGTELAVACHMRVCTHDTQIGAPEVKIGIIPGWGGTQRMPHLMGEDAFPFIQEGEPLFAEEAKKMGLIDVIVSADSLLEEAQVLAQTQPQHKQQRYDTNKEIHIHPDLVFPWPKDEEQERALFATCFGLDETKQKMKEFLAI